MKRFIAKLIVVSVVIAVLLLALLLPVAGASHAQALIACPPTASGLRLPCTGGGVICVDRHGHVHRWHGHVPTGWHCVAI